MAASWPWEELLTGLSAAEEAYGEAVRRELIQSLGYLGDRAYRRRCNSELRIKDTRKLGRGLAKLSEMFDSAG